MSIIKPSRRLLCRSLIAAPFVLRKASAQIMIEPQITPNVPAQAQAVGYTKLAFSDEFTSLSTIDINNTKAGGFKWYVNNAFPATYTGGTGNAWHAALPTPPSAIAQNGSYVTLLDDFSHNPIGLCSVVATGSGVGQVSGTSFSNGFYAEVRMSFDPTLSGGGLAWHGWPIYWFISRPFLDGTITNGGSAYMEIDGFEGFPTNGPSIDPIMTLHDYQFAGGNHNSNNNKINSFIFGIPGFKWTDLHTLGTLYVTMANNGGTGYIKRYLDDVYINKSQINGVGSEVDFNVSLPCVPGASPSNPNGTFTAGDSWDYPIMLGTGHNWPTTFDFVRIWQAP